MSKNLRAAVIGCGGIGHPHAKSLAQMDNVDLIAVCDIVEGRAREFTRKYGAKDFYTSHHDLLARDDIDFVCVTTANNTHAPLTIDSLRSGKHVMVQKPIAMNLKEADEMIAAGKESGKKLMCAFFEMFHPALMKAKQLVDEGAIGKVFLIKAMMAWYMPESNWRFDAKVAGGGILMDGHVHHAAFFKWFTGTDVESVYSEIGTLNSDAKVEDTGVSILRSKQTICEISGSNRLKQPCSQGPGLLHFKEHIELFGSEGCIIVHTLERPSIMVYAENLSLPQGVAGWFFPHLENKPGFDERIGYCQFNPEEDPWVNLHQHFVECIEEDKETMTPGEYGRDVLEIIRAGYKSAKEKRQVNLPLKE